MNQNTDQNRAGPWHNAEESKHWTTRSTSQGLEQGREGMNDTDEDFDKGDKVFRSDDPKRTGTFQGYNYKGLAVVDWDPPNARRALVSPVLLEKISHG